MLRSSDELDQEAAIVEVIHEPTLNEIYSSEQNAVYYTLSSPYSLVNYKYSPLSEYYKYLDRWILFQLTYRVTLKEIDTSNVLLKRNY